MFYCWMCCGCLCFWNIHEMNRIDFGVRQFFLGVWGVVNYFWFSYNSYSELFEGFHYLVEYLHLEYLVNAVAGAMIAKNLQVLLIPTDSHRRIYYAGYDSRVFMIKNAAIIFIHLLHSPFAEGYLNTIYCLFPVLLQGVYLFKIHWNLDNFLIIVCLWGLSELTKYLGFDFIYSCIYNLIINFGIYFIEYPIIICLSVYVGRQMEKVVINIENYAEIVKTRGKTKNQVNLLVMKELSQYALLGFSLIFVHYFGEIIEWYHGYMPVLISFIINVVYSYPAVILLKFPESEGDYGIRYGLRDFVNFAGVLFSNYLIRCLV